MEKPLDMDQGERRLKCHNSFDILMLIVFSNSGVCCSTCWTFVYWNLFFAYIISFLRVAFIHFIHL